MAKRPKAPEVRDAESECDRIVQSALDAGRVRLKVFIQDQDWISIEGDRESLAFLGGLLASLAKGEGTEYVTLDSPETAVFHPGSLGIILSKKDPKRKRRRTKGDS